MHLHLAAAYPGTAWVEHFEWLEPLFDERPELRDGRMRVPDRPGLGLPPGDRARGWTVDRCEASAG
ncbi:enolase C-terminal domain-like protein [Streptomyces caniferus]|uniref:enolase C-terminal domain-like protein n=1 Tax=Streptomyces caniferus TaxID=285557 RepID=UPI003455C9F8